MEATEHTHASNTESEVHRSQPVHHGATTSHSPAEPPAPSRSKKGFVDRLKKEITEKVRPKHVVAGFIYLVIALVVFYPITLHMTNVAPGVGGDIYSNIWGMWWISYTLLHAPSQMWHTYLLFWPVGSNIAYFTTAPIASILMGPFQAVSLTFAYNMIFFMGFVISGIGMFILADYITKNGYAAFLAGVIFAYSSYHIAAMGHLDWMDIGWIPITLYFFLRMLRDDRKFMYSIGFAISMVLAIFMGDIEQGIMTVVLLFVVLVCYLIYPKTRRLVISKRFVLSLGLGILLTFIVGSWGFIPLLHGITTPGGLSTVNNRNTLADDAIWSDPILSFFLPSPYNGLIGGISSAYSNIYTLDPTERVAYIGYIALALSIYAIVKNFKTARIWIIIAVIFGWLTLGPYVEIGAYSTAGLPGIYQLYHYIPLFSILQEADRFYAVFSVAIAMLAAIGLKEIMGKMSGVHLPAINTKSIALVGILSVLILIESTGIMTPRAAAINSVKITTPPFYSIMANYSTQFSILQLPIILNNNVPQPDLAAGEASYYTAISHKPILGGYGGRINTTQQLTLLSIPLAVAVYNLQNGNFTYSSPVKENYTAATLLSLYNYETAFVVLNEQALGASQLAELYTYCVAAFGQPVYRDNSTIVFSTLASINASIFRSYVSYPQVLDWQPFSTFINGSTETLWEPVYPGLVSVFAPYKNTTDVLREVSSGLPYTINTTVSFSAAAVDGPTRLIVETPTSASSYSVLLTANLTSKLVPYSFNTNMVSGPDGNPLLFLEQGSGIAGISNITVRKSA